MYKTGDIYFVYYVDKSKEVTRAMIIANDNKKLIGIPLTQVIKNTKYITKKEQGLLADSEILMNYPIPLHPECLLWKLGECTKEQIELIEKSLIKKVKL
jgi:hypothetical protein